MLQLRIEGGELYDENAKEFIFIKPTTLQLEHSLVSLSKWESQYCVPFLTDKPKTVQETIDYIKCMTITQNVDPNVYRALKNSDIETVNDYIGARMTATWFSDDKTANKRSREPITSELIYYSMIANNIPFECQKWHLNRLLTLIRVCNIKNDPDKHKMSKSEIMRRNASLNAARRQKLHTTG